MSAQKEKINTCIRVNDNVLVISGADRGRKGKVLLIDRKRARIIVEGVNKRNKHVKPSQENPKGGLVSREYPIAISNVSIFCDKCKKGALVGYERKERLARKCKRCGKSID